MENTIQIDDIENLLYKTTVFRESYLLSEKRFAKKLAPEFNFFNLFTVNENTISNCLAFLLNPNESHAQGDIFLRKFCTLIGKESFITEKGITVNREYIIAGKKRIDLYINSKSWSLAIENKPWAQDQFNQLSDYGTWLYDKADKNKNEWVLVYLCNNDISDYSLAKNECSQIKDNVKAINFFQLAEWLLDCALNTEVISVKIFIENFSKYIREYINMEPSMEFQQELTEKATSSYENKMSALFIAQNINNIKHKILEDFIEYIKENTSDINLTVSEFGGFYNGEIYGEVSFEFKKGDEFYFYMQFVSRNYNKLSYGIASNEEITNRKQKNHSIKITKEMEKIFPQMEYGTSEYASWYKNGNQGTNIPFNLDNDPQSWELLLKRDDDSFAQHMLNMIRRIHDEMDLVLFHEVV